MRFIASFTPIAAALAPVLALTGCESLERSLIFPGTATQNRDDTILAPNENYALVKLTTRGGVTIVAQFGAALESNGAIRTDASDCPTVIYFYGNGACLAYSQEQFFHLRRLGVNVIVPEYPGYGMSSGAVSERACYEAADATYDHLLTRDDVGVARIMAVGWSMGAAVAVDLASRRPVSRLVTISAFTSLPAVARTVAPWAPTSLIIRSHFDNAVKLPSVSCPVLIVHGARDELVPAKMAGQLAALVHTRAARRIDVPLGSHNDIFQVGGAALWTEIGFFLNESDSPSAQVRSITN